MSLLVNINPLPRPPLSDPIGDLSYKGRCGITALSIPIDESCFLRSIIICGALGGTVSRLAGGCSVHAVCGR